MTYPQTHTLKIRSVLGVESLDAELGGGDTTATLISGKNASGKTSVATALMAVLARDPNPLGLPATDYRHYLLDGSAEGTATLIIDGEETSWHPLDGRFEAPTSRGAEATAEIAGLVDFLARRPKRERARMLQDALLPSPDIVRSVLAERLVEAGVGEDDLPQIIDALDGNDDESWNTAEKIYRLRAKQAKSEWQEITAKNWGAKSGANWAPAGFESHCYTMSTADAEDAVARARDELAIYQRQLVINEQEAEERKTAEQWIDRIRERERSAGKLVDGIRAEVKQIGEQAASSQVSVREAEKNQREAADAAKPLAAQTVPQLVKCPVCAAQLRWAHLRGDLHLTVYVPQDNPTRPDDEQAELDAALDSADDALREARQQEREIGEKLTAKRDEMRVLEDGHSSERGRLQRCEAALAREGDIESEEQARLRAQAEETVEVAKKERDMIESWHRATRLNQTINEQLVIAEALGPSGVRKTLMDDAIASLNNTLRELSSGWPKNRQISVVDSGAIFWGDRPAPMCSESERWTVQAMVQLALAMMRERDGNNPGTVVLDRCDVIDAEHWTTLMALLADGSITFPVVLCGTSIHEREHADICQQVVLP